jgi:hypothetical protein
LEIICLEGDYLLYLEEDGFGGIPIDGLLGFGELAVAISGKSYGFALNCFAGLG